MDRNIDPWCILQYHPNLFFYFIVFFVAHAESLQFPATSSQPRAAAAKRPPPTADDVNPDNFMQMETKKLRSDLPEIMGYNEETLDDDDDDDDDQRKTIAEAFEDDDVLVDFQKEKADIISASKPKA